MSVGSLSAAATPADIAARECESPWGAAFERFGDLLHRYIAVRVGGDIPLTDDLSQQLWLQARSGLASVPRHEIEFWLRSVAKNLVRTHWRRVACRAGAIPIADGALAAELAERMARECLPQAELERKEVQDQLLLGITELGLEEQTLILGHYFEGLPHRELAERLSISPRAVEGRLYRARLALRDKLRALE